MVADRGLYTISSLSAAMMKTEILKLSDDNIYHWSIALIVLNPDSLYYGGYFKAVMTFPKDYPYVPPGNRGSS